jgi:uncharacterized protein (TIGR00369 family)
MNDITYGSVDKDTALSMSGLEFAQRLLSGALPAPPMARTANIGISLVEEGRVVFRGAPTEDHLNPVGTTHGGWFGTILDSALGCAVLTIVPQGSVYTTLEYKINLVRGIAPGTVVLADARIDHAGRSTAVATGEIRGESDGRLYATGSTTCLIMKLG